MNSSTLSLRLNRGGATPFCVNLTKPLRILYHDLSLEIGGRVASGGVAEWREFPEFLEFLEFLSLSTPDWSVTKNATVQVAFSR